MVDGVVASVSARRQTSSVWYGEAHTHFGNPCRSSGKFVLQKVCLDQTFCTEPLTK